MKKYYNKENFDIKKSHLEALMKDSKWKHERNEIL